MNAYIDGSHDEGNSRSDKEMFFNAQAIALCSIGRSYVDVSWLAFSEFWRNGTVG